MQLLSSLARREGSGVVIVSHEARLESVADRVLCMEEGRVRGGAGAAMTTA